MWCYASLWACTKKGVWWQLLLLLLLPLLLLLLLQPASTSVLFCVNRGAAFLGLTQQGMSSTLAAPTGLRHSSRALRSWWTVGSSLLTALLLTACAVLCRFRRGGKKGHVQLAYKLSPRGCAGRIHPQWIPQLQLHMATTGCQSVLLASR
jgi:hypothetical protein